MTFCSKRSARSFSLASLSWVRFWYWAIKSHFSSRILFLLRRASLSSFSWAMTFSYLSSDGSFWILEYLHEQHFHNNYSLMVPLSFSLSSISLLFNTRSSSSSSSNMTTVSRNRSTSVFSSEPSFFDDSKAAFIRLSSSSTGLTSTESFRLMKSSVNCWSCFSVSVCSRRHCS